MQYAPTKEPRRILVDLLECWYLFDSLIIAKNLEVLPDPEEYDILFNHNGPTPNSTAPSGSVSDVFMANSYDSFVLETKVVPYWVDIDRTEQTTVAGNYGLNLADTHKTW